MGKEDKNILKQNLKESINTKLALQEVLREKQLQPWILYLTRLSFIWEEKRRTFSDKQNLKEFTNTRTDLQEIQKGVLSQEN